MPLAISDPEVTVQLFGSEYYKSLLRKKDPHWTPSIDLPEEDWAAALYLYSPHLYAFLEKYPELCAEMEPAVWLAVPDLKSMRKRLTERKKKHGLHKTQKLVFAEILLLDLYRRLPFPHLVGWISELARYVCESVVETIWGSNRARPPGIIAMGKLGGSELNYSSDIDLIFVMSDDADPISMAKNIQLFMRELRSAGHDGFLYRVDARLRPQGQSGGALVRTVDSYMNYYKRYGQTWEKQAFIKANFLCGDETVSRAFLRAMDGFIYGRITQPREIREIRAVKNAIEQEIASGKQSSRNIKLQSGGIRDIEFIVQLLQMVHGTVYPELRVQNHLSAIRILASYNIIATEQILTESYILFRELEHRLQCRDFSPVRLLPEKTEAWEILRHSFPEYRNQDLLRLYEEKRKTIRDIFRSELGKLLSYMGKYRKVYPYLRGVSDDEISRFLFSYRDEYLLYFRPIEIADHYNRLMNLSPEEPVSIFIDKTDMPDIFRVNLAGYDRPFLFSYLVGELSIHGCDLIRGKSFTSRNPYGGNSRAGMVSELTVKGEFSRLQRWKKRITGIIRSMQKRATAQGEDPKSELRRRYFEKKISKPGPSSETDQFFVSAKNHPGSFYTVIEITGHNYSGFLFESITVLQELHIQIIECDIRTEGMTARDIFHVTRTNNKRIEDDRLHYVEQRIALMKFFSRNLHSVADPVAAYAHFFQIIAGDREILPYRPVGAESTIGGGDMHRILHEMGLLLGSGEFIRQRFYLAEGIHFALMSPMDQKLSVTALARRRRRLSIDGVMRRILRGRIPDRIPALPDVRAYMDELIRWMEGSIYDIAFAQIKGSVSFLQLSGYFDFTIRSFMGRFVASIELEYLLSHGISIDEWCGRSTWVIWGLGKLGGRELGYGSDLEIVFIYRGNQEPDRQMHWSRIVQQIIKLLPRNKRHIFHVDLRLRPHGDAGPLAVSYPQFRNYHTRKVHVHPFETQAMIKGSVIATRADKDGRTLAEDLERIRGSAVFENRHFPVSVIRDLHARQIEQSTNRDLKYGRGGLVEMEYSVQLLQMCFARRKENADLLSTGTITALRGLRESGIISGMEYATLLKNYSLFRILINALRFSLGREDAYIVPPENHPLWHQLWKLCKPEVICASRQELIRITETARMETRTWWDEFDKRFPSDWIQ